MLSTVGIINIWLVVCLILALLIMSKKIFFFICSVYNQRKFISEIKSAIEKRDLEEIHNITKFYPNTHIAWAIGVALKEVNDFGLNQTCLETIQLVNNSIERCKRISYLKFNSRLHLLLSLGITSPMIGLFASIVIIEKAFHCMCNTEDMPVIHLFKHLSFAPYELAYGLIVGTLCLWFYFYFLEKTKFFFVEYDSIVSDLMKCFARL